MLLQTGNCLSPALSLATTKLVALLSLLNPLITISSQLLDQLQPLLPITELSIVPSSSFLLQFKQAVLNNVSVEISFSLPMKLHLLRISVIGKILVARLRLCQMPRLSIVGRLQVSPLLGKFRL